MTAFGPLVQALLWWLLLLLATVEISMRTSSLVAAAVVALASWSCGGGSSGNPAAPPAPPAPTPAPATVTTINIQSNNGAKSFAPNPGTVIQGNMVIWQNSDTQTHHIVLNDGTLDTGDIAPGKSSAALRLAANGARYHCTIHPTMVGSINSSAGEPPPCSGDYC
jgi:plastocyanin